MLVRAGALTKFLTVHFSVSNFSFNCQPINGARISPSWAWRWEISGSNLSYMTRNFALVYNCCVQQVSSTDSQAGLEEEWEGGNSVYLFSLSNIKIWGPVIGLWPIHLNRLRVHEFGVFQANSNVKSTFKSSRWVACYFGVFVLDDEGEVRSSTIIPSLRLGVCGVYVNSSILREWRASSPCRVERRFFPIGVRETSLGLLVLFSGSTHLEMFNFQVIEWFSTFSSSWWMNWRSFHHNSLAGEGFMPLESQVSWRWKFWGSLVLGVFLLYEHIWPWRSHQRPRISVVRLSCIL